jgi:peroxiredoxin
LLAKAESAGYYYAILVKVTGYIMHRLFDKSFMFSILIALLSLLTVVPPSYAAATPTQETAPDFTLSDMQGIAHNLVDYRGSVVVLNFWASWCPECVLEMPSLDGLYNRLKKDGLVVIGVSVDRARADIAQLAGKVSYPILLDERGDVFVKKYTITRLPATIIIDREGGIVKKIYGGRDFSSGSFIGEMTGLLQEKKRQ